MELFKRFKDSKSIAAAMCSLLATIQHAESYENSKCLLYQESQSNLFMERYMWLILHYGVTSLCNDDTLKCFMYEETSLCNDDALKC